MIPRHTEQTHMHPGINANFLEIMYICSFVPTPVKRLIDSIGIITFEEKVYLPVLAKTLDADGNFLHRPEKTVLSTLRDTVVALANPETPHVVRTRYEYNNAIPGAVWLNHILQNADEIMPAVYNFVDDLHRDFQIVVPFLLQLQKLVPKLAGGALKQKTIGHNSIFLSNEMENLRCPDRNGGENLNDYYNRCIPQGDVKYYSSLHKLNAAESLEGQVNLLGEVPTEVNMLRPLYGLRDETIHPYVMTSHYKSVCHLMYA
ncbi:Uncharacterized protein OBRU01_21972 [Operophtera brumata]|uniref:Uncharacterized protein n=1 Tax=Operophtera brumata TaxID=104452 RepID=A0A0L7KRR7_OPEBR|nr:Uncharacterized protein OBRU01_21972 [Operophtera brumata]